MSSPARSIARRVANRTVDRAAGGHLPCVGEGALLTVAAQRVRRETPVIELARARDARRHVEYTRRTRQVIDANKRALGRLFQSGLIYSRVGARLARDLLLAHQHLLKVADLGNHPGRHFVMQEVGVPNTHQRKDARQQADGSYGMIDAGPQPLNAS